jgi:hypothetical protein
VCAGTQRHGLQVKRTETGRIRCFDLEQYKKLESKFRDPARDQRPRNLSHRVNVKTDCRVRRRSALPTGGGFQDQFSELDNQAIGQVGGSGLGVEVNEMKHLVAKRDAALRFCQV